MLQVNTTCPATELLQLSFRVYLGVEDVHGGALAHLGL